MGQNHKNPVVFSDGYKSDELTVFAASLNEFAWKNRLVGMTASGMLYVDDRVPKVGYYEFHPKLLPWKSIEHCRIEPRFSVKGVVFGLLSLAFGILVFFAGWINKTHTGPGVVIIPIAGVICGAIFILGARRNRIEVVTQKKTYFWISDPLALGATRPFCVAATALCQSKGVYVQSTIY